MAAFVSRVSAAPGTPFSLAKPRTIAATPGYRHKGSGSPALYRPHGLAGEQATAPPGARGTLLSTSIATDTYFIVVTMNNVHSTRESDPRIVSAPGALPVMSRIVLKV